jgi:hypothetical protein
MACLFNQTNTPIFTSNNFKSIAISKDGVVWAATNGQGIYYFDKGNWNKWSLYTANNYQDIKADQFGGVWVAQSGTNGVQALQGGVFHFPNKASFDGFTFYTTQSGLPSRFAKNIFVDITRTNGLFNNPKVWVAHMASTGTTNNSGAIALGLNSQPFTPFSKITAGVDVALDAGSCQAIGGNSMEVWVYANVNFGRSQILRYDAATHEQKMPAYDYLNVAQLTQSFSVRSIYFDNTGNKWIGMPFGAGLVVQNMDGSWSKMNNINLISASTSVNANAITGADDGKVFIGTTTGLLVYKGNGLSVSDAASYYKFTMIDGLPSNNIQGIDILTKASFGKKYHTLLLATDKGIIFWEPPY